MRIFIAACITAGVLAVIGAIALSYVQEPAKVAFSTEGVRVD
jgi:Tfp pilus assembly major pilin PilA